MRWIRLQMWWMCLAAAVSAAGAENRVLQLDGRGSYVKLPDGLAPQLESLTIEGWFQWHRFAYYSQPIAWGQPGRGLGINNYEESADLQFFIYEDVRRPRVVRANNLLRLNQWIHLACVVDRGRMELYVNGTLTGEEPAGPAALALPPGRFLGKPPWSSNADFCGWLDEVRIWNRARTPVEIQGTMFRRLTGGEEGLVALWNFEDGTGSDAGPRGFDGRFLGSAECVPAVYPRPEEVGGLAVLMGTVTDETSKPASEAEVRLESNDEVIAEVRTGLEGRYQITLLPGPGAGDLSGAGRRERKRTTRRCHGTH